MGRSGEATVNFRLLPGDTVEDVIAHVKDVVDDPEIEVRCAGVCREATPQSETGGEAFDLVRRVMLSVYPDAVVAPYLVIGGTDARYYQPLTEEGAFRFLPVRLTRQTVLACTGRTNTSRSKTFGPRCSSTPC